MCGYPKSGKSEFVDLMTEIDDYIEVIRPSDFEKPDDENVSDTDWKIGAWQYSLDLVIESLNENNDNTMIVFDTCGASPYSLDTIFNGASLAGHKTHAIYIDVPPEKCAERCDSDIVSKYEEKIPYALEFYQTSMDGYYTVEDGTIEEWREKAKNIIELIYEADKQTAKN